MALAGRGKSMNGTTSAIKRLDPERKKNYEHYELAHNHRRGRIRRDNHQHQRQRRPAAHRAAGNQITKVYSANADPNLLAASQSASLTPRSAGNQITRSAGVNNDANARHGLPPRA